MRAGDATFGARWTLHGAPGNPTQDIREVMDIIYFAKGTRVFEPKKQSQQNDLNTWAPGVKPGELAASALNPLQYCQQK
jgi:hypothetical protein